MENATPNTGYDLFNRNLIICTLQVKIVLAPTVYQASVLRYIRIIVEMQAVQLFNTMSKIAAYVFVTTYLGPGKKKLKYNIWYSLSYVSNNLR